MNMFDAHAQALAELKGARMDQEMMLTQEELNAFSVHAAKMIVQLVEKHGLKSKNTVATARKIIAMDDAAQIVKRIGRE